MCTSVCSHPDILLPVSEQGGHLPGGPRGSNVPFFAAIYVPFSVTIIHFSPLYVPFFMARPLRHQDLPTALIITFSQHVTFLTCMEAFMANQDCRIRDAW